MICATNSNCLRLVCQSIQVEPTCVDLSIVWGTDNQLEVTITDGDGRAVVITTDTIALTVKEETGGATVFSKSNGPGEHSAPALGRTVFAIDAADTAAASATAWTYWVFEVRRTTGGGETRVHISGAFAVRPAI